MLDCTLSTGDCLAMLPQMPAGCAKLAFLDPPFNIGLDYPGYDDSRPDGEFFAWLEEIFRATIRVLAWNGSLWVQCGQTIQAEVKVTLQELGLHWRNSVVWHYTFGPHQKKKFVPSWQMLHYFTVDASVFTFNADAVRVPSARQMKYNDKRANPKGRLPDDAWILRPQDDERFFTPDSDAWHISRVCGTYRERVEGHSCQTPLELLERVIKVSSNPGDLVVDPMAGTGSTGEAALRLGRRFAGIELCLETAEKARERLAGAMVATNGDV